MGLPMSIFGQAQLHVVYTSLHKEISKDNFAINKFSSSFLPHNSTTISTEVAVNLVPTGVPLLFKCMWGWLLNNVAVLLSAYHCYDIPCCQPVHSLDFFLEIFLWRLTLG